MNIPTLSTREFPSLVIMAPGFAPEPMLSRDKPIFAVVDSAAQWFFERHLASWSNIRPLVIHDVDESMKTQSTVDQIHEFLFTHRAERSSSLLAVGGGIILDTDQLKESYERFCWESGIAIE